MINTPIEGWEFSEEYRLTYSWVEQFIGPISKNLSSILLGTVTIREK